MNIVIRAASYKDSDVLTAISFAAKRHWNYPDEYFDVWKDELTITPSYIQKHIVYVAERSGQAVGYFSLVEVKTDFRAGKILINKGTWLEHIFILPEYIGKGIGTQLIDFMKIKCKEMNIGTIHIFSDCIRIYNFSGDCKQLITCSLAEK